MKILLISGFLGAGKTSFISEMVKATKKNFVIVENEFANKNIDKDILQNANKEMKIWEMTEGCICCSTNLDFGLSILTIANSLNPDYLIIEPSGVALPSNIIAQINKVCYERIELLPSITIVDALNYHDSKIDFPEYFYNQINNAQHIILSKTENLGSDELEKLANSLDIKDKILSFEHYTKWDKSTWNKLFEGEQETNELSLISPEQKFENLSFSDINNFNVPKLISILNLFSLGYFGKIVRAKGYFKTNIEWIRFDFVNKIYTISSCDKMSENKIVVIGENLNKDLIKSFFNENTHDKLEQKMKYISK